MKKLFADPHFNVMDGLDTYIDDYAKPDPIPPAMLRQLASAKFLKPLRRRGRRARGSRETCAGPAQAWHSRMTRRTVPASRSAEQHPASPDR